MRATFFTLFLILFFTHSLFAADKVNLTSINIVDRNGFSETISNPERLKKFASVDFIKPQPYKKVMRIFSPNSKGEARALITSYHDNGQPKQYLEVVNGRASGFYLEWHSNGSLKLKVHVISGTADIVMGSEKTWLFDGVGESWDDKGNQLASIPYEKGELQGISTYFHPTGEVWKIVPYEKNHVHGEMQIFLKNGDLLQKTTFVNGVRAGASQRFWTLKQISSDEHFVKGLLEKGEYYSPSGEKMAGIKEGNGFRAIFGKDALTELHEYKNGTADGEVKILGSDGEPTRIYRVKNRLKSGEEIEYYPRTLCKKLVPKLSIEWYQGKIQGLVRTWYPNGVLESQKEMNNNLKQGVLTSWYVDGEMMLMEEYENDKLVRGDYYRKGERGAISQVRKGKGLATLYDSEGHFIQKVSYQNGKPISR